MAPEDREVRLGGYAAQGLVVGPASSAQPVRTAHYAESATGRLEWVGTYEASSFRSLAGTVERASDDPLAEVPVVPGPAEAVLSQRYLDAAAWTGTDLWLRPAAAATGP